MIPPLRQRKEDISTLFHHFIKRKSAELKLHSSPRVTAHAIDRLKSYHWPGNVRELQNLVERALIRSRGRDRDELALEFWDDLSGEPDDRTPYEPAQKVHTLNQVMIQHIQKALRHTKGRIYGEKGAAALLDINPNTLRSRMRKLKIPFGSPD